MPRRFLATLWTCSSETQSACFNSLDVLLIDCIFPVNDDCRREGCRLRHRKYRCIVLPARQLNDLQL
jgi:hypothetical protein